VERYGGSLTGFEESLIGAGGPTCVGDVGRTLE